MSAGAPIPSPLEQTLSEETRELRAFLAVLEREQQALQSGNADLLLPIADDKTRCASRLAAIGLQRAQWLAGQGFGSGRTGLAAWLAGPGARASRRAAWNTILDLAAQAHALNEENGALIRTRMQHNQQALAILLAATDQAALYGRDGQTLNGPGKRHLGSA